MILNTKPNNEAILSNVGEIGEFHIRTSAKAFGILSSSLYANKIRAIIRELSCNAIDSHMAAGKPDIPFDIHLPNSLEPWFSIRDYGVGMSHDQVTDVYTTYFESTKSDSNDFIGALGLGSKTPFSYTDNFSVTSIKDGWKGIYTAFINESGVPSIALMSVSTTEDCNGVEIRFSVNDNYDFGKFRNEAKEVYTHFKLIPNVLGFNEFQPGEVNYKDRDVVPGIHYVGTYNSYAVMGNIAYPISIPNAESCLGDLAGLLRCGLEIHFDIGELDFQPSREGLSYIPQTISAIKDKLTYLKDHLTVKLTKMADEIPNIWDRAAFLNTRRSENLWNASVREYVIATNFVGMTDPKSSYSFGLRTFAFKVSDLAQKYNIEIQGIQTNPSTNYKSMGSLRPTIKYVNNPQTGVQESYSEWTIEMDCHVYFVTNDLKTGAGERAKYHWRNYDFGKDRPYRSNIYILNAADKTRPANYTQFLKDFYNPSQVVAASSLLEKPRKASGTGANVSILKLEPKSSLGWNNTNGMVWRDAGDIDNFDSEVTYYYLPMNGFVPQSERMNGMTIKNLHDLMSSSGVKWLNNIKIYGVRKKDLDFIKEQPNWINLETHIESVLSNIDDKFMLGVALGTVDNARRVAYNSTIVAKIKDKDSPYLKLVTSLKGISPITSYAFDNLEKLTERFAPKIGKNPKDVRTKLTKEVKQVHDRYTLLKYVPYHADESDIYNYINIIDKQMKGN